jgi:hypothetical protein
VVQSNSDAANNGGILPALCKRLSTLRRVGELDRAHWAAIPGNEGCIGLFQSPREATPIIVEAISGRSMAIVPEDIFLATAGHRESVRWTVGGVPEGGLIPGKDYWILAESGVIGELVEASAETKAYVGKVKYLGAVIGADGEPLNLRDFAARAPAGATDIGAPIYVLLGTSVEVGKTTAGLSLLRTLLSKDYENVVVLKATGTASVTESMAYLDFGAAQVFDCLDFGVPTTFPSSRPDAPQIFGQALDVCLSLPADAVLIECGGNFLGTSVPEFLQCLMARRSNLTTILAASDSFGALGAKRVLDEIGLKLNLITGPCSDTQPSRKRTEAMCGVPARNMRTAFRE